MADCKFLSAKEVDDIHRRLSAEANNIASKYDLTRGDKRFIVDTAKILTYCFSILDAIMAERKNGNADYN